MLLMKTGSSASGFGPRTILADSSVRVATKSVMLPGRRLSIVRPCRLSSGVRSDSFFARWCARPCADCGAALCHSGAALLFYKKYLTIHILKSGEAVVTPFSRSPTSRFCPPAPPWDQWVAALTFIILTRGLPPDTTLRLVKDTMNYIANFDGI